LPATQIQIVILNSLANGLAILAPAHAFSDIKVEENLSITLQVSRQQGRYFAECSASLLLAGHFHNERVLIDVKTGNVAP
jgi:hypothetical protein